MAIETQLSPNGLPPNFHPADEEDIINIHIEKDQEEPEDVTPVTPIVED